MIALEYFAFLLIMAGVLAFYNENKRSPTIGIIAAIIFMLAFFFMGTGREDGLVIYMGKNVTTTSVSYLDPATNITEMNTTAIELSSYDSPPGETENSKTALFVIGVLAGLYYVFVNVTRIWGARD